MKKLLFLALMISSLTAMAQADYDVSKDPENGQVVFKGQTTFSDLLAETTFGWLERGADSYKPDSVQLQFLKKNLGNYELVVLMGTWCDDSHILLPQLYKILQLTGYPMGKYLMYGLDREKTSKYVEHKVYKVTRVPTIIVYKNHMEVGRIVESVEKSMEADLAKMIATDMEEKS